MSEPKKIPIWFDNKVIGYATIDQEKNKIDVLITDKEMIRLMEENEEKYKNISIGFKDNNRMVLLE